MKSSAVNRFKEQQEEAMVIKININNCQLTFEHVCMHVSYVTTMFFHCSPTDHLHRHRHRVAFKHQRKLCVLIFWRNFLLIGKVSIIFHFEEIKRNRKNRKWTKIGKWENDDWICGCCLHYNLRRCVDAFDACLCGFEFFSSILQSTAWRSSKFMMGLLGCKVCSHVLIMNWKQMEL